MKTNLIKMITTIDSERRICISNIQKHLNNKLIKDEVLRYNKILFQLKKHEDLIIKLCELKKHEDFKELRKKYNTK